MPGSGERSKEPMLDIVANIVFGAGAVIGIWLPVFAYQCAVRSIHSAGPDE
jgi:hypothetical protein